MLEHVISGIVKKPEKMLIYGEPGVGKSTLASLCPKPIVVATEDGVSHIDVDKFPTCKTYLSVKKVLQFLSSKQHFYETVVVDSLDWLEKLIWAAVCQENNCDSIADLGYGKGYKKAAAKVAEIISLLDKIVENGIHVVCIAHEKIEHVQNPETKDYHRHTPRLHNDANDLFTEWAYHVIFAYHKVIVKTEEGQWGSERGRGVGGQRFLRCNTKPGAVAKNRAGAPDDIAFDVEGTEFFKFFFK